MRIYPEKLSGHLTDKLLPVYCISGDEPLLIQECCDLIRTAARTAGCNERKVIDAGAVRFNWQSLLQSTNSLSLFSEKRLVELRLPSGKPGTEGSKALCEYLDACSPDDVFLILSGKIDKASTASKWYRKIDSAGVTIQVWPVSSEDMPQWLSNRIKAANLSMDLDAVDLLAELVQGNLLAAVQEISKLRLLAGQDGRVTRQAVTEAVLNNARYSLFGMIDSALAGNTRIALRMLRGLRMEGVDSIMILWALARECRMLFNIQKDLNNGKERNKVFSDYRIWKSRTSLFHQALDRHNIDTLNTLLRYAVEIDSAIKGLHSMNPWLRIEDMVVTLCQPKNPSITLSI